VSGKLRIVFLGTPEFAVSSLDILYTSGYDIAAVVTAPDTPAGRGQKIQSSPVKKYAVKYNIPVLQPVRLKDPEFLEELKSYKANLQVIVAFRMLPEVVWNMPALGTFNLHASLLPRYRGAAPINWAIINGEKETGVTTFFLRHEIDTGNILLQERVPIGPDETAGELHDKLESMGAELVLKTVRNIEEGNLEPVSQDNLLRSGLELKPAPKIFRNDCQIEWDRPAEKVHNFIRGLSPYPAAFTHFTSPSGDNRQIKVFKARPEYSKGVKKPGSIDTDGKKYLKVSCSDGWLDILELQQAGKRKMAIHEFLMGASVNSLYMAVTEY
jgi:methionyl-tRNA formyltransferase